jgi:hypothetical protein
VGFEEVFEFVLYISMSVHEHFSKKLVEIRDGEKTYLK